MNAAIYSLTFAACNARVAVVHARCCRRTGVPRHRSGSIAQPSPRKEPAARPALGCHLHRTRPVQCGSRFRFRRRVILVHRRAALNTLAGGIIYGWLRFHTGSLLFPFLAHSLGNLTYSLMATWRKAGIGQFSPSISIFQRALTKTGHSGGIV